MLDMRRAGIFALGVALAGCGLVDQLTETNGLTIRRFAAIPPEIVPGGSSTLSWNVEGADSVEIDNGIGSVKDKGTLRAEPRVSTTYTLRARGAASESATATVLVTVRPGASPSPTPTPSPSPTPSPTPTPTPSPSPSSTPTPSPSPSPSGSASCGTSAGPASGCSVTITRHERLNDSECLELNEVTVSQACPVAVNTTRSVSFRVTARTPWPALRWRRAATGSDLLNPSEGRIEAIGTTSVVLTEQVLDRSLTIEVLHRDALLLSFTLRNN